MRAYPEQPSLAPGDALVLHVASEGQPFQVQFFRAGASFEPVGEALGPWRAERVERAIPRGWRPGAYVAQCYAAGEALPEPTPDARDGAALFVVRSSAARMVVNLPLFTYHAYNIVEPQGDCLYTGPTRVSLARPGGGTGAHLWDEVHVDVYDPSSPRQTFAHWDAKGLAWLERSGYEPAVCTDLDLHAGTLPAGARLLVAFGHQEYWTANMRENLTSFLAGGGNVALFCGNTAWFRVRYDAAAHALERDGKWCDRQPEEHLLGTSYRFGGGRWRGPRPATGYTVSGAKHWVFAGTGLRDGDTFGAPERLIGYECDGCAPAETSEALATASLTSWDVRDGFGEVLGGRATLLAREHDGATLFNAATIDWARVLERDATVARITRNVLERLG